MKTFQEYLLENHFDQSLYTINGKNYKVSEIADWSKQNLRPVALNISDIQKFLLSRKEVEFKVKKQKNLNSIIVRSDTNLNNVKIYKKSLIRNDSKRLIYQSLKDENKIIFNDKNELENVVYRLEFDNQISFNVKEFVINEIKNDYNCIMF